MVISRQFWSKNDYRSEQTEKWIEFNQIFVMTELRGIVLDAILKITPENTIICVCDICLLPLITTGNIYVLPTCVMSKTASSSFTNWFKQERNWRGSRENFKVIGFTLKVIHIIEFRIIDDALYVETVTVFRLFTKGIITRRVVAVLNRFLHHALVFFSFVCVFSFSNKESQNSSDSAGISVFSG